MNTREGHRTQSPIGRQSGRLNDRGGAVLVLVALGLVVFLGMAALAIDLGLLYVARGEAQKAADAAAHAGAGFYQLNRDRADGVQATRDFVVGFAENNEVRGLPVRVDGQQDIDVLPSEGLVRVRVRRTDDGIDGPIPTLFARALGFREVGVSASAAAQIFGARAVGCMLPVALPDRWIRGDGSFPASNDIYDPDAGDLYDEATTGYRIPENLGDTLLIRPEASGGGQQVRITPSWWGTTQSDEFSFAGNSTTDLRRAIEGCSGDPFGEGADMDQSGGSKQALRSSWELVRDSDPTAIWNDVARCVTTAGSSECRTSPRLRPMVLFNPDLAPQTNQDGFVASRIIGIFIEDVDRTGSQYQVIARLARIPSTLPGDEVAGPGDAVTAIRIVE